jgi:hypothetical protein
VYLNGVCFTIASPGEAVSLPEIQRYLRILQTNGDVFLTPTVYRDVPAIRISVSNWRTTQKDIDIAWQALLRGFTQWQEQV